MRSWFRGKTGGAIAFFLISALVLCALGWATHEALRLEDERYLLELKSRRDVAVKQSQDRLRLVQAQAIERQRQQNQERINKLRFAMWRLDSRLAPTLSREESRPLADYAAIHSPYPALTQSGTPVAPGQIFLPSPLMNVEFPDWMILHFQLDRETGWISPQVVSEDVIKSLKQNNLQRALKNCTFERRRMLDELRERYPTKQILKLIQERGLAWTEGQERLNRIIEISLQRQEEGKWHLVTDLFSPNHFNAATTQLIAMNPTDGIRGQGGYTAPIQEQRPAQSVETRINPKGIHSITIHNSLPKEIQEFYIRSQRFNPMQGDGWAIFEDGRNFVWSLQNFPQKTLILTDPPKEVSLGAMKPVWIPNAESPEYLMMVRSLQVGERPVYQGFVCDWAKIKRILKKEIEDVFPEAEFTPLPEGNVARPDRTMTSLPVELNPNLSVNEIQIPVAEPVEVIDPPPLSWTPLRLGLVVAWAASLIALIAVGLGGWSLIDLSERRIRFVSAVTHELRTPMTTLRLYLDMLASGMVSDENQKIEYLNTLRNESERLNRLIANVLDFARLEKSNPTVEKRRISVHHLLEQLLSTWKERCAAVGKELVIDDQLPEGTEIQTDPRLVEQILGNFIDNAQKYSQDATDPRIYIRARQERGRMIFEIEDRGPGVNRKEQSMIFRAFRRGQHPNVTAGGVGLGLALASRWASLLNAKLSVHPGQDWIGACFRLEW